MTWPTARQFAALMGDIGVGNDDHIILYASKLEQQYFNYMMWCTRAWWIMHHFGVHCSILNGNLEYWIANGGDISTSEGSYPQTTFICHDEWQKGIAYKADVKTALRDQQSHVINALPEAFYNGTADIQYGPRKGHITGSINVPLNWLIDWETGIFNDVDIIKQCFSHPKLLDADTIITYCGGGGCATTDAFTLKLLGVKNRLFKFKL